MLRAALVEARDDLNCPKGNVGGPWARFDGAQEIGHAGDGFPASPSPASRFILLSAHLDAPFASERSGGKRPAACVKGGVGHVGNLMQHDWHTSG